MNISRERLEEISKFMGKMVLPPSHAQVQEMARALLAVMDAKDDCPLVELYEDLTSSKPIRFAAIIALTKKGFATKEAKDFLDALMRDRDLTTPPAPSAPDGWIKCSDRMPDEGSEVLVINEFGDMECACYQRPYIPGDLFFATCSGEVYPTHWMTLPAAPGGE